MHENGSGRQSSPQLFPSLLNWFFYHRRCCHLQTGMADTAAAPTGAAPYGAPLPKTYIRDLYQNGHKVPTQANCQKKKLAQQQQRPLTSDGGNYSSRQDTSSISKLSTHCHHNHSINSNEEESDHHHRLDSSTDVGFLNCNYFPFDQLPKDCKLKVFECLDLVSRWTARRVCREWNRLIMNASLWSHLDFTEFPLCFNQRPDHVCSKACYATYCARMKTFMLYLAEIKPALKWLRFEYDIEEGEEGWLASIEKVLSASRCHKLQAAHINWKETPIKPFWVEHCNGMHQSADCNDFMYKHRLRHRTFVNFFENFVSMAPNISSLRMQFGWSMRSICNLSLLRNLHTLVLDKYFVFQPLNQASIDQLFKCTPKLRKLVLEVWTPSGQGLVKFHLRSPSLQHLDLSKCRGFYLESVDLPALQSFVFQGHPWNGPLVFADTISLPCLRSVLAQGAPQLKIVNNFAIEEDWNISESSKFEEELRSSCMCRAHKKGYVM